MIFIYSEANKNAEKIAGEVENGIRQIRGREAASLETRQTKKIAEAGGTDVLVLCVAKKNIGSQLPNSAAVKAGQIYIAGAGLNLKDIAALTEELKAKNIALVNSICLRRSALLAGVMEDNLKEEELARARAFGERIALSLTGQRARQHNEKNRIKNYQQ